MEQKVQVGIFGVGFLGNRVGRGGTLIGCVEKSGAEVVALCDNNEKDKKQRREPLFLCQIRVK